MSILIKGIEMPKSCATCKFMQSTQSEYGYPYNVHCSIKGFLIRYSGCKKRDKDCPLHELPPHGRLIDADAFANFISHNWDKHDRWFVDIIEARPTIIEAEEKKDG